MNEPLLKKFTSLESLPMRALLTGCAWLLLVCTMYAQTTISGRVTSGEDASPLPGVNILVKGTTDGTISNGELTAIAISDENI